MDLFSFNFPQWSSTSAYFFTLYFSLSIFFPDAHFSLFSICHPSITVEQEPPFAFSPWFAFHPHSFPAFLCHILSLPFPDSFLSSLTLLVTFKFSFSPFCFFFLCPIWLMFSFSVPPSSFSPFMISNNLEVESSFFFPPLCCFFPLPLLSSPFLYSWFYLSHSLQRLWSSHIAEMTGYTLHSCVRGENAMCCETLT